MGDQTIARPLPLFKNFFLGATVRLKSWSFLLYKFSESLLREAIGFFGWGIRPPQGLYHQFNCFSLVLQPDLSLDFIYCRGFLNPY